MRSGLCAVRTPRFWIPHPHRREGGHRFPRRERVGPGPQRMTRIGGEEGSGQEFRGRFLGSRALGGFPLPVRRRRPKTRVILEAYGLNPDAVPPASSLPLPLPLSVPVSRSPF